MSALGIALLSLGLLAAGAAIGFYLARLGQSADQAKLDEVETEFDTYREQVTEHFAETASRFTAIGQQYRELYDHLAAGSESLCLTDKVEGKLPFPPAELERIAADEAEAETGAEVEADLESAGTVDASPPPEAAGDEAEPVTATEDEAPAELAAEPAAVAEIDSGDEPAEAPGSDESADDDEAERGSQVETAAALPEDAESGEPLEGEIVDEGTAVKDNVVELVPRSEARDDDTGADPGPADGGDKRTYH